MSQETVCPGCGLRMPSDPTPLEPPTAASPECWRLYGEVSARIISTTRLQHLHQLTVDTYFAQHPGQGSEMTTAFALIGLHLALDLGANGIEVRKAHQRLGNKRRAWPRLTTPDRMGALTVFDVALTDIDGHETRQREWSASVWASWSDLHAAVAGWLA